ncbi:MAG: hypothetical protein LBU60_00790, partial [Clostridiales bacterium]|nr:hypothetical protein [Clostridiales bacterium]
MKDKSFIDVYRRTDMIKKFIISILVIVTIFSIPHVMMLAREMRGIGIEKSSIKVGPDGQGSWYL